jgi:hypothetical protein
VRLRSREVRVEGAITRLVGRVNPARRAGATTLFTVWCRDQDSRKYRRESE